MFLLGTKIFAYTKRSHHKMHALNDRSLMPHYESCQSGCAMKLGKGSHEFTEDNFRGKNDHFVGADEDYEEEDCSMGYRNEEYSEEYDTCSDDAAEHVNAAPIHHYLPHVLPAAEMRARRQADARLAAVAAAEARAAAAEAAAEAARKARLELEVKLQHDQRGIAGALGIIREGSRGTAATKRVCDDCRHYHTKEGEIPGCEDPTDGSLVFIPIRDLHPIDFERLGGSTAQAAGSSTESSREAGAAGPWGGLQCKVVSHQKLLEQDAKRRRLYGSAGCCE